MRAVPGLELGSVPPCFRWANTCGISAKLRSRYRAAAAPSADTAMTPPRDDMRLTRLAAKDRQHPMHHGRRRTDSPREGSAEGRSCLGCWTSTEHSERWD